MSTMDVIEAKLTPEQLQGFYLGNILKYAARLNWKECGKKDAEKVRDYATKLVEILDQG
jgi:hypothetical protein